MVHVRSAFAAPSRRALCFINYMYILPWVAALGCVLLAASERRVSALVVPFVSRVHPAALLGVTSLAAGDFDGNGLIDYVVSSQFDNRYALLTLCGCRDGGAAQILPDSCAAVSAPPPRSSAVSPCFATAVP